MINTPYYQKLKSLVPNASFLSSPIDRISVKEIEEDIIKILKGHIRTIYLMSQSK